jgi:hypothetical protein
MFLSIVYRCSFQFSDLSVFDSVMFSSSGEWEDGDPTSLDGHVNFPKPESAPPGRAPARRSSQSSGLGSNSRSGSKSSPRSSKHSQDGDESPRSNVRLPPAPSQGARPSPSANPQIQIALSGSKLIYADNTWTDVSDKAELMRTIHPVIGENMSLKKRAELLVRLVAQSQYETQQIDNEISECDDVIRDLHKMLGDEIPEENPPVEHSDGDNSSSSDL